MKKASRFKDSVVLDLCSNLMEKKKKELLEERNSLDVYIDSLEKEIAELPKSIPEGKMRGGIPFSFIPYLYCPKCNVPLKLDSASMDSGLLQSGELWCDCGFKAEIKEGMILCSGYSEDTPFKAFENVESVASMASNYSPAYRRLIDRANLYMYNRLSGRSEDPKIIMTGPFTLNFILAYINKLDKKNLYLVFDPSKKRLEKLRDYLLEDGYNMVYIAANAEEIPVKEKSVDAYIDDYCTANSMFTYNTFNIEKLASLLKPTAIATGVFNSYVSAPKSLENFKKIQPDFKPKNMSLSRLKYSWEQAGFGYMEKKNIGSTSDNSPDYPQDVRGEHTDVIAYCVRRKGSL